MFTKGTKLFSFQPAHFITMGLPVCWLPSCGHKPGGGSFYPCWLLKYLPGSSFDVLQTFYKFEIIKAIVS